MRASLFGVCLMLFHTAIAVGDQFDEVRAKIESATVAGEVPSLAVAVARHDEILWEAGFGWADRENRVPATEHTMYSLASISKPITATALMLLVEQGAVDLDAAANDYLGDAQLVARIGNARDVTIRRLANHTAGLPLHYQFFYADEMIVPPPADESIRRYGVLMRQPGERYQYANFGYGVLDAIISRQSGRSYAEFLREEVFLPLGMTRTSVDIAPGMQLHAAVRYAPDQSPIPFYTFDHPGASAVYSSAHDLVRFGMFHLQEQLPDQKQILQAASIDAMQQPTAEIGDGRQYGVGWFINSNEFGYRTISHTGGMGGVRTRLCLVPSEGLAVVALCNTNSDVPLDITREILAALLPDYKTELRKEAEHNPAAAGRAFAPPELVGYWSGHVTTHEGERPIELWAQPDGDLHVKLADQLLTVLNESRLQDGNLTGVFGGDLHVADANRRPYQLHLDAKLRGESLNGSVAAISLPGPRAGNALSYWIELQRVDADPHTHALFNGRDLSGWRVVDKYDFQRHGKVAVEDSAIVLHAGQPGTAISATGPFPRMDYEVAFEAQRIEGSDFFCGLTFPVEKDYLTLVIGGWGGGVTGISNLNDNSAVENETSGYTEFEQDRWYKIRLRVTPGRVAAWLDDEQIVNVDTQDRRLSIWWEQEPVRPFGIASWYTKAAIRRMTLKRIQNSEVRIQN